MSACHLDGLKWPVLSTCVLSCCNYIQHDRLCEGAVAWPKGLQLLHWLSNVTVDSIRNLLHCMLSFLVLVSEKAPQPPPMVCDLTLYWFQRRPLNLLPWYVILHCIGFREGPSTSPHGMLSYIELVSDKAPQPPPMVCYLTLHWFQTRPLNLLPWWSACLPKCPISS